MAKVELGAQQEKYPHLAYFLSRLFVIAFKVIAGVVFRICCF